MLMKLKSERMILVWTDRGRQSTTNEIDTDGSSTINSGIVLIKINQINTDLFYQWDP